ncbi:MAG: CCA tRNA nucleotidyltransferase [Proteobacteria bacterium]|nr:CCA tRNA nucleotidyltransferase [Pseudomonadota bacterium]
MLPWQVSPSLLVLFNALTGEVEKSSNLLRFVGGCVRDYLLKKPWYDVDLATPLSPEEVITRLQKEKIPYITPGISHGTVTAIIEGHAYQITTLRCDVRSDGRRAIVSFTEDWRQDAYRRDFTINALFMDWTGTLYDFVDGEEDLSQGRIRFVGNPEERIQEDFLRILRLFRMFSFYGREPLEKETLDAVRKYAPQIKKLSTERIHAEFLRLLESPSPLSSLTLMSTCGVLKEISESLVIPSFFETLLKLEAQIQEPNPLLRVAALLLQTSKNLNFQALKSFLIRKNEIHYVLSILSYKKFLISQDPLIFSKKLLSLMKLPLYRDVMILKTALFFQDKSTLFILKKILQKAEDENERLVFPIKGKDLLSLGIKSGPDLGKLLKKTQEFWMENECSLTKEECIAYVLKEICEKEH